MIDPVKLHPSLLDALKERGHDDEQAIVRMTPRDAIRKYAGWHLGEPSWGSTFFDLVESARSAANFKLRRRTSNERSAVPQRPAHYA